MSTRREFLKLLPASAVVLLLPELAKGEGTERVICEWREDENGMHWLHLGLTQDGKPDPATRTGVLAKNPEGWWFRFGRWCGDIKEEDLEKVKRNAEQRMVEYWRQCLVELERVAFRIR